MLTNLTVSVCCRPKTRRKVKGKFLLHVVLQKLPACINQHSEIHLSDHCHDASVTILSSICCDWIRMLQSLAWQRRARFQPAFVTTCCFINLFLIALRVLIGFRVRYAKLRNAHTCAHLHTQTAYAWSVLGWLWGIVAVFSLDQGTPQEALNQAH